MEPNGVKSDVTVHTYITDIVSVSFSIPFTLQHLHEARSYPIHLFIHRNHSINFGTHSISVEKFHECYWTSGKRTTER